ncbi:sugar-binding protein [Capnocytophaga sp.]|uniref:sugar-binding protein n=1 Tax=Capnocytophaga sp. TaxID=44737 RepID=UPI0026DC12E2|nr:sugar-binding protein [Capnocytophaga sp.]MDO5105436.1 sugar-binding protein [Capnocytophaga sp.]
MLRILFMLSLVVSVFNVSVAQVGTPEKPLSRLEDYQLRGKVKTYKLTPYHVLDSFGIIRKDKKPTFWKGDILSMFDNKGYKVESEVYNRLGKLQNKIIYKYDDKNRRLSRDVYGENGLIKHKYVYVYDENGHKTAYQCYSDRGEIMESWLYSNDNRGRETEVIHQTPKRSPEMRKYTYKYDNAGKLIELTKFAKNNMPEITWKYNYDKRGQVVVLYTYKGDKLFRRKTTSYDAYSNPVKSMEYDGNGRFIEETDYEYQFDNHGNWIQRVDYVNSFPKIMYEREITYY